MKVQSKIVLQGIVIKSSFTLMVVFVLGALIDS